MNTDLQKLIELQKLDLQTVELQEQVRKTPKELEALRGELQDHQRSFESARERLEEDTKQRRALEAEVESLRAQLSKYKSQLMEVKTNKAYQAMLHEIENTERKIEAKEDEILEHMMSVDQREEQVRRTKLEMAAREQEIQKQQKELEDLASQAQAEIDLLQAERKRLEEQISRVLTHQYERIASVRNGVALAEARDYSCQACHVKLRPQLFADLKANDQIITCENCNRILYYAESQTVT